MTATIPHQLVYNDNVYSIIGIDGEGLFNPTDYKVKTIPTTACSGFISTYCLINNSLRLSKVCLNLDKKDLESIDRGNGIKLFGKVPRRYIQIDAKGREYTSWDFICDDLKELISFTGGMLIGYSSLSKFFTVRGLPLPYTFKNVWELIFDSGQLMEAIDCSQQMSQFRKMQANGGLEFKQQEWLEECFSFYYSR